MLFPNNKKIPRTQQIANLAQRNGLRHAIFNTVGDKYVGDWQHDLKTGKGGITTRCLQLYEGDVFEGFRHGFGVLAYEEAERYIMEYRGGWRKGRMDGFGKRRYRDGGFYMGEWKSGKRHGYGMMWYPNGDFYAGDFVKDLRQGLGMLVHPNKNRYEGSWFQDMKHGNGKYVHLKTGQMQQGVWNYDFCVFCTFRDLKYRQSAVAPTPYPIQQPQVINIAAICETRKIQALEEKPISCLSLTSGSDP